MKAAFLSLALFMVQAAHAAPLSPEQVRTRVASIPEVKAVYGVYKGGGWKCQNTQAQLSSDGGSFEATKQCENTKAGAEASAFLTIKGFVYGEGSNAVFVVESIGFNHAG